MFYLFPFGDVPKSEGVIIYGAGDIGQLFIQQLEVTRFFSTIYVTDKKITSAKQEGAIKFVREDALLRLPAYPIIVASLKFADEIELHLKKLGVNANRVVKLNANHVMEEGQYEPHTFDWNEYYKDAEGHNEVQFQTYLEPLMQKYNFNLSVVMDFACGKGRIADLLSGNCESLICVDTSQEAISHCASRFDEKENVECRISKPEKIPADSGSVSFIYSWDAMVHFDYKSVDYILSEFSRILSIGGYAVLHHSNAREHEDFKADKNWRKNPHCRSEFNAEDMRHICRKSGFIIEEQQIMDWGIKALDCISVIRKC